jgi:hypothetical protein
MLALTLTMTLHSPHLALGLKVRGDSVQQIVVSSVLVRDRGRGRGRGKGRGRGRVRVGVRVRAREG